MGKTFAFTKLPFFYEDGLTSGWRVIYAHIAARLKISGTKAFSDAYKKMRARDGLNLATIFSVHLSGGGCERKRK